MNLLTMVGKLEASIFCLRESTRPIQLSGNQAACSSRSSGGPCAQLGGQARKAPISP